MHMRPEDFQLKPACEAEMKATRMKKRVYEILQKAMAEPRREGWARLARPCRGAAASPR